MKTQDKTIGVFTPLAKLEPTERELVKATWAAAANAYTPRSNFPVGSVILAQNSQGDRKIFAGCNVENRFFPATICAERNAITSAVAAGYRKLLKVALVCAKYQGPGASPCGLCRQALVEFGCDAVMLNMADTDNNVRKFTVGELLPAAGGEVVAFENLSSPTKRLVRRLMSLRGRSYVPYSKQPHAAVFIATHAGRRVTRHFAGVSDDNSSYGGSALAECVAMRSARTAGYSLNVTLAVTVDDPKAHNPIEGECLQVLREFGLDARVLLVGNDRSVVCSTVEELLPDSFGPQALA